MDASLAYATTPLALASLAVIAGVGILKLLVSGKNNALNRLITHYGFFVVIVFGLLGNVSYLISTKQSSEVIVFGNVVDSSSGAPLPKSVVDAGPHARGMTSDTGDFVLAIPASRVQDRYKISASMPGYGRSTKEVENKSRMFVTLELKRKGDTPILKFGEEDLIAAHYLGVPEVYLPIALDNIGLNAVTISNLSLTLTAPSGKVRQLVHAYSAPTMNGPLGPAQPVTVRAQEQSSWVSAFFQYDHQLQLLSGKAFQALQSSESFRKAGPRVGETYLTAAMDEELQQALQNNWFWEPGTTSVRLVCTDDTGRRYDLLGKISLSAGQIQAMKKSSDYYTAGYGIIVGQQLTPVGSAQPGQRVKLENK